METLIDEPAPAGPPTVGSPCHSPFSLREIQVGQEDKLGNVVKEILWCGKDYIVYRTDPGVHVNFSDCAKRESKQREAFTEICPELCELRFLTHEMKSTKLLSWLSWRNRGGKAEHGGHGASLFEHNIAQALMLLMEDRPEQAKAIARAALEMAVVRCTNDNTIRYVMASMVAALLLAFSVVLASLVSVGNPFSDGSIPAVLTAALFGVLGAAFSVITRVRSFQMKPCQQSNMNYLMAWIRILIGLIAGVMLYLVVRHPLGNAMIKPDLLDNWEMVAIVGFLGGFAERLVATVFRRSAATLEDHSGTPVQAARKFDRAAERLGRKKPKSLGPPTDEPAADA